MRPIRLALEGFTAYREMTVVDFDGVDLFVLTGPTGSGKSSLIDAMTFALYGSVSRYGNPNLVHPVISQGKLEARVRFDFALGGRSYSAVRVVRRTKGGATTREARLESEGTTLAGNADEVSRLVRRLLGLNFEQFNTCVVLPQGEFARFLHETPADRQDLLTKLLGVDVYETMGALARVREAESKQKVLLFQDELERMADATEASKLSAKRRLADLRKVKIEIEAAEPELDALREAAEKLASEAVRLEGEARLLSRLEAPEDALHLADELREAKRAAEKARRGVETTETELAAIEKGRAALGDEGKLRELEKSYRRVEDERGKLTLLDQKAASAASELSERAALKKRAEDEERDALARLDETRRTLAAHDLREHLVLGGDCPVCGQAVASLPPSSLPPALSNAEKDLAKSRKARDGADRKWQAAANEASLAGERAESVRREIAGVEETLSGARPASEIASALEALAKADEEIAGVRRKLASAREEERRARREVERLAGEEARGWSRFDAERDAVSALRPPAAPRDDLARAWNELLVWSRQEGPKHRSRADEAETEARKAAEARERRLDELEARCRIVEVRISRERPRDAVVTAVVKAEQELERIQGALERARRLREEVETETERARVAGALGQHLRSTGFERWLLEEAFRRLVQGATEILNELSSGQYSFEYDGLHFEVIDHRNADERRSARTLSGGETFLASLALALTLAEETAELAAEGSARLESLFLDEGFGTLDDETLDVVASAITELGAKGRVVGLVTHQPNLAAMIPVQYRISKSPATSTVEKVVS